MFAQKHLRILSGLYGVLRPLDVMKPYRLEMGTKLNIDNAKNLYEFWGDDLKNKILLMRQKNFGEIINETNGKNDNERIMKIHGPGKWKDVK